MGNDLRELVRRGVARMRERRESEQFIAGAAAQDAEAVARRLIVFARIERVKLRGELRERFGFSLDHGEDGYVCCFEKPTRRPKTPEETARWVDLFVHAVAFEEALLAMNHAATDFAGRDQARMVCNAFLDAMRESPTVYGAVAGAGFEPTVREYAAAMLTAWTRSHLHKGFNPKLRRALGGEGWEQELVKATALAWADRDPDAPLKRGTRFRDTLRRTADGRRQKAPGPPDLVNLTSAALEGRDTTPKKPEPPETGAFTLAEQERLRRKARDAGLTPQERQVFELFVSNPRITNPEIAAQLGITRNHAGVVRSNVLRQLGA